MIRRFLCFFGRHSRGSLIERPGIYYRSICKGCDRPIVRRTGERHWRLDREAATPARRGWAGE